MKSKKFIAIISCCIVLMTGCSFFDDLGTDTTDNGSAQSATYADTDSSFEPHTDSEVVDYLAKEMKQDNLFSQT